jgi:hypothetical protein
MANRGSGIQTLAQMIACCVKHIDARTLVVETYRARLGDERYPVSKLGFDWPVSTTMVHTLYKVSF